MVEGKGYNQRPRRVESLNWWDNKHANITKPNFLPFWKKTLAMHEAVTMNNKACPKGLWIPRCDASYKEKELAYIKWSKSSKLPVKRAPRWHLHDGNDTEVTKHALIINTDIIAWNI